MKYKVGDKVRVREWDDMEKEFGLDEYGGIVVCGFSFDINMKELCGKEFVVESVGEYSHSYLLSGAGPYGFSEGMLESVEEKEAVNHPSHYQGK